MTGFFIVEAHVLSTTASFRSERDVEELWDALVARLTGAVDYALKNESDPEGFLRAKEDLMAFIITLEVRFIDRLAINDECDISCPDVFLLYPIAPFLCPATVRKVCNDAGETVQQAI